MSDLIKREDAIKALEQRYEDISRTFKRKVKIGEKAIVLDMIGCVKNLPSADRPQEWIPCSEREPNEFEDVLVLLSDGTRDVLRLTDYLDIWGNAKWCHTVNYGMGYSVSSNDVVAWMPLPQPMKGADDE